ncbi:MAG: cytochrome c3 family protein [bacterium]
MKYKNYALICYFLVLVGALFTGCSDLREPVPTNSPAALEVHSPGWLRLNSPEFHGLIIRNNQWDWDACQRCHGEDFKGGISGIACSSCHPTIPHPRDWIIPDSENFHGKAVRAANWQMSECLGCHGQDYAGATTGVSCLTCHPATPEDCTVCHGGVDNLTGAPPEDLDGNRDADARGVGAHTAHLSEGQLAVGFGCGTCHVVPDSLYAAGHVDSDLPAEVSFSKLALVDDADPTWQAESESCQNAYCHGNWRLLKSESGFGFIYSADSLQGNSASPTWTDPTTVTCGTCHNLPPQGHTPYQLNECTNCHFSVIDASGLLIDKTKHVNGNVNVFGQEYPIF